MKNKTIFIMASMTCDPYLGPKYHGRNFEEFIEYFVPYLDDEDIEETNKRIKLLVKHSLIQRRAREKALKTRTTWERFSNDKYWSNKQGKMATVQRSVGTNQPPRNKYTILQPQAKAERRTRRLYITVYVGSGCIGNKKRRN
jgi:hypothetical protein